MGKVKIGIEKRCTNFLTKGIGLMFSNKPKTTLLVNKREKPTSIHTFFMKFYIDVYWLDDRKKIVHKQKMKPWMLSKVKVAKYVLETKSGVLDADVGDEFVF